MRIRGNGWKVPLLPNNEGKGCINTLQATAVLKFIKENNLKSILVTPQKCLKMGSCKSTAELYDIFLKVLTVM